MTGEADKGTLEAHIQRGQRHVQVNANEARRNFKQLLDRVERGEEIVVLMRGRAVARLVPEHGRKLRLPDLAAFRAEIGKGKTPSAELVREERDDR
ncbi:MAG: type II toxin-antitoxin system prevent-host-death family antitoxin [Deltaproteobacteria bacterium]|nr:MAG: type II toxin-antitoxin system prevent-host-death family antitoxin [Deltaproteobacteria bacterium]